MSSQPRTRLTVEEYLEAERKAEYKSEYWGGEVFAMAGARRRHNRLAFNLLGQLYVQLRDECEAYGSDMRVAVDVGGLYTYPDATVVCGERRFLDDREDTLLNPTLIVEVLSESTEAYDRGRKFESYRTLPSLMQYVLVASDRVAVEVYTRDSQGLWVLRSSASPEATIELGSIGCRIRVADLYKNTGL